MLEELAAGQVSLATVWFLGVSMGLTACTVTCLPFMGTWALGRASGQREALLHTGVFLAGRVFTYMLLATLAGAAGLGLAKALGGTWGNAVIGGASILAGLWLLAKPAHKACGAVSPSATAKRAFLARPPCSAGASSEPTFVTPVRVHRRKTDSLPPLFLGAALSLTPCMPLASLLALAASAGSAAQGAAYGLAFGLGAAMTPILVLVPLAGRMGRELRAGRTWMARWLLWTAAAVLIVLGLRRLMLAF
ncbi:MAG: sulfite exporter TauE/SafE family protein [Sulfuritalea sp.]|nr:sulfite exporter TauE/SafE family protein [Sulfuritalea sp.]